MNFLEALAAIPKPIPTQQMRECPDCHGTGERGYGRLIGPEESQHYRLCEDCDGEGEVPILCAECEAPKMHPTAGCDCDSRWWCDSCVANDCAPMAAYPEPPKDQRTIVLEALQASAQAAIDEARANDRLACVRCDTVTSDGELCSECQVEEAEGQWELVRCETPLSEIHNTKE